MSASNSGDSMEWGRGRSSGSRKGKRAGSSSSDKPRQPQRGLGVAQLEKIRIQSEMAEYLHHPVHPLGQPPPIHRTGSFNLLEDVRSNSLPSTPSSSFHSNMNVSSSYPIYPNLTMAYGERSGGIRYGEIQTNPVIRSPNYYHGAIYGSEAHYSHQGNVTLPLFEPEESIRMKGLHDLNRSADSSNSDDQQEVDLELKL
ncbi:hypothetical protein ACP4OV_021538 [Aristida adscensionis]